MHEPIEQPRFAWITRLAFGLLLSIVIARCLMLEVVREALVFRGASGPGPTTSLLLDWLTFVPMLLILVRRLVDTDFPLRFKWVHIVFALLAIWTLVSVSWSGDRFVAMVGAMQILAGASLFWSISQLVRRWDHLRIVVGICVGLLLANVAQSVLYRTIELPDTQRYFQENKAQILAESGWKSGEFSATRFEQKLMAGEMLGFNVSPNTLGALMVMLALIALGAAMQRAEDRDDQGWIGLVFLVALSALYPLCYTNSKASWGALIVGVALLCIWRLGRRVFAANRGFVFAVATAAIALGIVSLIALGLSRGGLPEDSLNFRWRYWIAAWESLAPHPLTGAGWANFSSAFLQYRLPVSAEEITDPHNFVVRWASELGLVGACLGVAWLTLWAWSASRIIVSNTVTAPMHVQHILLVGIGLYLLSFFGIDTNSFGQGDGYFEVVLELLRRLLLCGLITLGVGILCIRNAEHLQVDTRPAPWLAAGLFVGLIAFLIQSGIDISFFQPGPFMLCLLIMGSLLGLSTPDRAPRRTAFTLAALIVTSIAVVISLAAIVIPTLFAEQSAAYARRLTQNQPERAMALYEKAFEQSPVRNADYLLHAASIGIAMNADNDAKTRELLARAIAADPTSVMARLTRGRWLASRPNDPANITQAIEDFSQGIRRNPNEIQLRIEFADLLERSGNYKDAAAQLAEALKTNDAYDPAEPERIELRSPGELERIRAKIVDLRSR